jgi:hypothetical protein
MPVNYPTGRIKKQILFYLQILIMGVYQMWSPARIDFKAVVSVFRYLRCPLSHTPSRF